MFHDVVTFINEIHTTDLVAAPLLLGVILILYLCGNKKTDRKTKLRQAILIAAFSIFIAFLIYLERVMPYGGGGW